MREITAAMKKESAAAQSRLPLGQLVELRAKTAARREVIAEHAESTGCSQVVARIDEYFSTLEAKVASRQKEVVARRRRTLLASIAS